MPDGVKLSKKSWLLLNAIRLDHRVPLAEFAKLTEASQETIRRVMRNNAPMRDFNAHALMKFLERYQKGEIKFRDGKAIEVVTSA